VPCGSSVVPGEPDERRAITGVSAVAEDDAAAAGGAGTRGGDADEAAGGRPEDATADTGSTIRAVADGRPWILDAGTRSAGVQKVDPASGVPTR